MPWDAWVLTFLILISVVIVVGALIEDIRGAGNYDRELRARGDEVRRASIRIRGCEPPEHRDDAVRHGRHRRRS